MAVVAAVVAAVMVLSTLFELGTYLRIFDGRLVATTIGLVATGECQKRAHVFK